MKLELQWHKPIPLLNGRREQMIYCLSQHDEDGIPDAPGIYVFARRFGECHVPLYIGQATSLHYRTRGQFNNLRLMRGIEESDIGKRYLIYAEFFPRPGQQVPKALDIIESALIEYALTQGFELLNKAGTKTPTHHLKFTGARGGSKIFSKEMRVRAR